MATNDKFRWLPLPSLSASRGLERELESWVGTPYVYGQRVKGMGVDCVQLIPAILDTLLRCPHKTSVPKMSPEAAQHDVKASYTVIKCLLSKWHGFDIIQDATIQPGDILVTRSSSSDTGPRFHGHTMFVGTSPWSIYHALPGLGVHRSSTRSCREVIRVYRPRRKDQWV